MAAGVAVGVLRMVPGDRYENNTDTNVFQCYPGNTTEGAIILSLGLLGMAANIVLMSLLLLIKHLRR